MNRLQLGGYRERQGQFIAKTSLRHVRIRPNACAMQQTKARHGWTMVGFNFPAKPDDQLAADMIRITENLVMFVSFSADVTAKIYGDPQGCSSSDGYPGWRRLAGGLILAAISGTELGGSWGRYVR